MKTVLQKIDAAILGDSARGFIEVYCSYDDLLLKHVEICGDPLKTNIIYKLNKFDIEDLEDEAQPIIENWYLADAMSLAKEYLIERDAESFD